MSTIAWKCKENTHYRFAEYLDIFYFYHGYDNIIRMNVCIYTYICIENGYIYEIFRIFMNSELKKKKVFHKYT